MTPRTIGILGAGSWGTALADVLARNGHQVKLWSHDPAVARQIRRESRNLKYLPDAELPPDIRAFGEMEPALEDAEVVVSASPSHAVREVMRGARPHLAEGLLFISATKGIEIESGLRMSQVIEDVAGSGISGSIVALSGPSFAVELLERRPTAVAAACPDIRNSRICQDLFQNDHFRIYTQSDLVGTELGGALKNVMALAAGISDGLDLGKNARAALLTRGLAEIVRLVRALGGEEMTLAGLAGVGDLILTSTGDASRNRRAGLAIGAGEDRSSAIASVKTVVEGVPTTRAARRLAEKHGVEMPIVNAVYSILYEDVEPRGALAELMAREPKPERWS